jgi:putative DNA primase/helicase
MPDENTVARVDRPLGVLDAEVKALKRDIEDDDLGDMPVEEINAWDAPVEGAALYAEVKDAIERHMDMPEGASTIVATWVFGTYCFDEFGLFPKLLISSPEKECGKSTLMEVIEALTYRGYLASNGTEAAIFRLIDAFHPALLLDETDRWVTRDKPGLIGIVNCGHTRRGAKVLRTVGDDHTPKNFSVWGPMALAGIRKPDDTIVSRSVEVELKRMPPGTRKEKVPIDLFQRSLNLRRKILRWYEDDGAGLHNEGLVMPDGGGDRTRDNWSVLLKIASRLGVLEEAAEVFRAIVQRTAESEPTIGVKLLADIKAYFEVDEVPRVHSATLVDYLVELEDRPWADWRRGFTQNKLAKLLEPYGVRPRDVKVGGKTKKGYWREHLEDAFSRYLPSSQEPPSQSATPLPSSKDAAFKAIQSATGSVQVAPSIHPQPSKNAGGSGVAFQTPPSAEESEYRPFDDPADHWENA